MASSARCHDATQHYIAFTATAARGKFHCPVFTVHIRPAGWEAFANPNAATQPTAYPIGASATNFGSHLIGKQFLNSPHGKFTGAYAQIATREDLYNSRFSDGTRQGGCDTCHDVHQSTIVKMYPFEYPDDFALASSRSTPLAVSGAPVPIRREYDCRHTDKEDLATLRHPGGAEHLREMGQCRFAWRAGIYPIETTARRWGLRSVRTFGINTDLITDIPAAWRRLPASVVPTIRQGRHA
jgi:hypothetical protein